MRTCDQLSRKLPFLCALLGCRAPRDEVFRRFPGANSDMCPQQHVLAASPNHLGASVGLARMPGDVVSETDAEELLRRAVSTSPRSVAAHACIP